MRGRNAFARDVGDRKHDPVLLVRSARPRKNVIVVTGDRVGGTSDIGDREARNLRRGSGKQPRLNFARDLQVALHHHAIGNLKDQQQQQQKTGPEVKVEFDGIDFSRAAGRFESALRDGEQDQRQ